MYIFIVAGYDNSDILNFNVNIMCALSKIYKEHNGTDIFDDFMLEQGKEPLPKYYEVRNPSNKKILVDEAGRRINFKKVYPEYLRVVK